MSLPRDRKKPAARPPREPQPQPKGNEQNRGYPSGDDVTEVDDHGRAVG